MHARNKLETRVQAAILSGETLYEIDVEKMPSEAPLKLRWAAGDDINEVAIRFCVAHRIDVDEHGRAVEVQMNKYIASVDANKNVGLMSSKAKKNLEKETKTPVEVVTLEQLEKVMQKSRVQKTSSAFQLNENRLRLLYMVKKLTEVGADGSLYVVDRASAEHVEEVSPDLKPSGWVHELNLAVFIHEAVGQCVMDYEPVPTPILAPYVGYMNASAEAKVDLELLRAAGFLSVMTVENYKFSSSTVGSYMSKDDDTVKWGVVRLMQLTAAGKKRLKLVDDSSRAEVESILFAPMLSSTLENQPETAMGSNPSKRRRLYRTVWHCPRSEFLLCCADALSGKILLPPAYAASAKRSTITDLNPVSFVCSPWLPPALQIRDSNGAAKAPSNSNRSIGEHAANIIGVQLGPDLGKQERTAQDALNEVLLVSGVNGPQILMGDWIPGLSENEVFLLDEILSCQTAVGMARIGSGPAAANAFSDKNPSQISSKTPSASLYSSGYTTLTSSVYRLRNDGVSPYDVEQSTSSVRMIEFLGVNRNYAEFACTVEPDHHASSSAEALSTSSIKRAELGEFALAVSGDGCAIYGVEIESIEQHVAYVKSMAEAKRVSGVGINVIHLSRALAQLQKRSTTVSNALFFRTGGSNTRDPACSRAELRQSMYGMCDGPKASCVPKYVGIVVGQMHPFMRPPMYLDGSDYETRISALIGRCLETHELSPGECILLGESGLLVCGSRTGRYQDILCKHIRAKTKERVVDIVSARVAMMEERVFALKNQGRELPEAAWGRLERLQRLIELLTHSLSVNRIPRKEIPNTKSVPPQSSNSPAKQSQSPPRAPADSGREKLSALLDIDSLERMTKRRVEALQTQLRWICTNCGSRHATFNILAKKQYETIRGVINQARQQQDPVTTGGKTMKKDPGCTIS